MKEAGSFPFHTEASAPGKLVVLGEYAVLEGAPAMVMAVDRRAHAIFDHQPHQTVLRIESQPLDEAVELVWSDGRWVPRPGTTIPSVLRLVVLVAEHAFATTPLLTGGGVLKLQSNAFYHQGTKLGLGSSAAVAVAAWHAFLHGKVPKQPLAAQTLLRRQMFEAVHDIHRSHQRGFGSGVDIAASTWGGLLRFEKERASGIPVDVACDAAALAADLEGRSRDASPAIRRGHTLTPLQPLTELCLTTVWTKQAADTVPFLSAFAELKQQEPARYWAHMEDLAALSQAGVELWHLGQTEALLPLFNRYHDGMEALGRDLGVPIVSEVHAELSALVRRLGGAYKPSGAGGGDFGIAVTRRGWQTWRLRWTLRRQGMATLPLQLANEGARSFSHPR